MKVSGIVFVVKFNKVNMKYKFLILRFHENIAYWYFCLKYFQWASPVLQKQFWNKIKDIGENQSIGDSFCR